MATPNYTIVSEPSYMGILAGANIALAGIASEAQAAKKAKQAYTSFADQLDASGLKADAAIYRNMAQAETPNYIEAALTGKGATRNLEMPFQQALKLLSDERDRNTSLQRAAISSSNSGGLSVTDRKLLSMEDSILTQDINIIQQDLRDANRDINEAEKGLESSQGNPELTKRYQEQRENAVNRRNDAFQRLGATQNQRRQLVRNANPQGDGGFITGDPAQAGVELPGTEMPLTDGGNTDSASMLLPTEPDSNLFPNVSVTEGRSDPGQASSRALRKEVERLALKHSGNTRILSEINRAETLARLKEIDKEADSNVSVFRTMKEAVDAGKEFAPDGFVVIAKPLTNGKGFIPQTIRKSASVSKSGPRTWSNGNGDIWFLGEDNLMYHRRTNQDPAEASMVQNEDGSAVTVTTFQTYLKSLGIAYEAGVTGRPPLEDNITPAQNARNANPNKVDQAPVTPARSMRNLFNQSQAPQ